MSETNYELRKSAFKFFIIIISIFLAYVFSDNIKGYYQFTQYCEKQSGLKVYGLLEANHGWMVDSLGDPQSIAYLNGVKFARYRDPKTNNDLDMRYISGDPHKTTSFVIEDANLEEETKYNWVNVSYRVNGEERLSKYGNEVIDNKGNKIIGIYKFSYAKFDRDYTPLDMNPVVRCPDYYKSNREAFNAWVQQVNSSFK